MNHRLSLLLWPRISRQTLRQAAAPQPPLLVIWLPFLLMTMAPYFVLWTWSSAVTVEGEASVAIPQIYQYGEFVFNVLLLVFTVGFLVRRYRTSLWTGWKVNWRGAAWAFAFWLCIFSLLRLPPLIRVLEFTVRGLIEGDPDTVLALHGLYSDVYNEALTNRSMYGPTTIGLVLTMLTSLAYPIVEELQFSGVVANRFIRRHRLWLALLATPTLVVLFHIIGWGAQSNLAGIRDWFVFSFCFTLMRVLSGNILFSMGIHMIYNLAYYLLFLTAMLFVL